MLLSPFFVIIASFRLFFKGNISRQDISRRLLRAPPAVARRVFI
jgi:hypothetical protein